MCQQAIYRRIPRGPRVESHGALGPNPSGSTGDLIGDLIADYGAKPLSRLLRGQAVQGAHGSDRDAGRASLQRLVAL
eukprot:scaffold23651_cov87-Phaeocystis_antarctica.AAC.2